MKRKIRILVVEDSATQRAQLEHDLEVAEYDVTSARSGEEALERIDEGIPALVITDINMPGIDGYELCHRIKKRHDGTPVMLLTSLSDPVDVIRGLECGADSFIVKPYETEMLLSRIAYVLANRVVRGVEPVSVAIDIEFTGRKFSIRSDRLQILNLLLSSYETAVQKNSELSDAQEQLRVWNARLEQRVEERTSELRAEVEKRELEQIARRESDERFRAVVSTMAEGVIVNDRNGQIITANAAAARMLGLGETDFLQRRASDMLLGAIDEHGKAVQISEMPCDITMRTGRPESNVILGVPHSDGATRWISLSTRPLTGVITEVPCGVVSTFQDVSERRSAELALRESEALFRGVLDAAPDAILVTYVDGRIVMANAVASTMFGYSAEELVGLSMEQLVPKGYSVRHRALKEDHRTAPLSRDVGVGHIVEGVRKGGDTIPLEIVLSPLHAGERDLIINMVRDMTQRLQIEEQLRQSQKMDAIGQLSGGIAHDFNNLLGIILGNLDLLERAVTGDEESLRRIEVAQKAAERGADLTQRLLTFSRRQQLSAEPISVPDSAANVIEMARRAVGPNIALMTNIDAELPLALADASGLENVLLNLIINSRDAMPDGGTVTIAAGMTELDEDYRGVRSGELRPGLYICLSVNDTGTGIPPEVMARVFEPFFTTKERGKGTGLGLAMVYGFAKQSGGSVSVYSEVGRGTTVKIYLPSTLASDAPKVEAKAPSSKVRLSGTALVVDDEVDMLEIGVTYLKHMGFTVLHAQDGANALAILERQPRIDLLLTDVMMPGMSGVELARRARELRPAIRVVFSTGFSSVLLTEQNGAKADGPVLNKPYRRVEFLELIEKAMGTPRE